MKKALILLLVVTGCADILDIPDRHLASESRCSGRLRIKMLYDASGGTADVGLSWFKGSMDKIRETNETGGIRGCTIDAEAIDYGYATANASAAYDAWKAAPEWNDVVAILGWGSTDSLLLAPKVRDDKKPFISASYFGLLGAPLPVSHDENVPELSDATFTEVSFPRHFSSDGFAYNFFAGTDYSTGSRIAMFHINLQGGKRVGFFHCSADYCTGPLAAAREYAKEQGLGLGRDLILELGDTQDTYNTKVLKYFQDEKAQATADPSYHIVDWVWGGNTTKTTAYMAKALAFAKADPSLAALNLNVQIIVNNWGFDEQLFGLCGPALNNPCVDKVHGIMPFVAYGDTRAGEMSAVTGLQDKWRARDGEQNVTAYKNVRYVQGYVNVTLFIKAAEAVISSGKEVTGENIKDALETFTGVSTGGLTDPLTYSPSDHRPQSSESIYKIDKDGKLVLESQRPIAMQQSWLGW
jgi:branched-chain amino acid transport system substrate-binding protein